MSNRERGRIFALSDTHLAPWPPVPAEVDLVLFGGDFYDGPVLAGCGDDDDANRFLFSDAILQAQRHYPPMFAVRGNHDGADPFSFFSESRDVTGRAVLAMPGLIVVGVGLAHREYLRLPTEAEMEAVCESSLKSFQKIVSDRRTTPCRWAWVRGWRLSSGRATTGRAGSSACRAGWSAAA